MKIFVKTLKGSHFDVEVNPQDTVGDLKKNIEAVQGSNVYPANLIMLIHQGKVLKDETTLEENKVAENSFVVVMLAKKSKSSIGESSTPSAAATVKAPQTSVAPPPSSPAPANPPAPAVAPSPAPAAAPIPAVNVTSEPEVFSQAASNLVAGSHLEGAIQQILDMGGGTWDRDTVVRALRAAYNNPERAVEYLYSGIPETADIPPVARRSPTAGQVTNAPAGENPPAQPQQAAAVPSSGPNASPLDLFSQVLPNTGGSNAAAGANTLDFLQNSQQFQALRAMVQANPQILQPMLQELGKQNPSLLSLIQHHQGDFIRLMNQPIEGGESNVLQQQLAAGIPPTIAVTPEEREAIERLEAMGFARDIVLEVFIACNKNEELAANYLLDHIHEYEEEEQR